jgi:hypothetical protein
LFYLFLHFHYPSTHYLIPQFFFISISCAHYNASCGNHTNLSFFESKSIINDEQKVTNNEGILSPFFSISLSHLTNHIHYHCLSLITSCYRRFWSIQNLSAFHFFTRLLNHQVVSNEHIFLFLTRSSIVKSLHTDTHIKIYLIFTW